MKRSGLIFFNVMRACVHVFSDAGPLHASGAMPSLAPTSAPTASPKLHTRVTCNGECCEPLRRDRVCVFHNIYFHDGEFWALGVKGQQENEAGAGPAAYHPDNARNAWVPIWGAVVSWCCVVG